MMCCLSDSAIAPQRVRQWRNDPLENDVVASKPIRSLATHSMASASERAAVFWISSVFGRLRAEMTADFAGVGLLVYRPPLSLPVLPMVRDTEQLALPVAGVKEVAELLQQISQRSSVFHDGFHLVDAETSSVTHVSQFFSPPIPKLACPSVPISNGGARHMAAFIGSFIPEVVVAAIHSPGENCGVGFVNGCQISV